MNLNKSAEQFLNEMAKSAKGDTFVKLTLSKPKEPRSGLKKVYVRVVQIRGQSMLSFTLRYATKDVVKNYDLEEAIEVIEMWVGDVFLEANLLTTEADYSLMYNKKRRSKLLIKKASTQSVPERSHNREKKQWINLSRSDYFKALGIVNQKGEVLKNSQRKYRQINKFVEIIDSLLPDKPESSKFKVIDVGSGKGYLTFALYDYLENAKKWPPEIYGIELRKPLVDFCNDLANQSKFNNLKFVARDIDEFDVETLDMLIALHACDIATDIAIAKGIRSKATVIVVAPCCHKQIRKEMNCQTEMNSILKHGILEERQAELITDGIRALLLEANGYKTKVFEFVSSEHTSKNLMIVGIKSKGNPEALQKVADIKRQFGIGEHYLEKLLSRS